MEAESKGLSPLEAKHAIGPDSKLVYSNKLIQSNTTIYYDKGGQGYMFRPRFEAIFRPFVVEQLIKYLHMKC
jgi:hypothetical protein